MNEILAQLVANAIDPAKIPGLDYFETEKRPDGKFYLILRDGNCIEITVALCKAP